MKPKYIEPIEKDEDGNITINLHSDAANDDWIRAARLAKKADAGDKKASAKLKKLFKTRMKKS